MRRSPQMRAVRCMQILGRAAQRKYFRDQRLQKPTETVWIVCQSGLWLGALVVSSNMKRRGRPPLPKAKRKSVTVCTRASEQSYRLFRRAAAAVGMSFTEWIRDRLTNAAEQDIAT